MVFWTKYSLNTYIINNTLITNDYLYNNELKDFRVLLGTDE